MRRFLFGLSAVVLAVPATALVAARLSLPQTACSVGPQQLSKVMLEMHYDDVRAAIGCDGVRTVDFEVEGLQSETFHWRGSQWPYSTFSGRFINGVLHGTEHRTVEFRLE